jgi:hypothetical protein
MWLSSLTDQMIKEAYDNGKFAQIHEYYKIANWKIVTDDGYRIPSIFDLEALVRSLCKSIEEHGEDRAESGGIFVQLDYNDWEQEELSFGFIDRAATAFDLPKDEVIIIDQFGNELKIVSVDTDNNKKVYQVKVPVNKSSIKRYEEAIKNKIWGKDNV